MQMWMDGFVDYIVKLQVVKRCLFRILVVKQKDKILSPLKNVTLVDVVMRSILPSSPHLLSANEVADAIEVHLQIREEDIWPSWTVRQTLTPNTVNIVQYTSSISPFFMFL